MKKNVTKFASEVDFIPIYFSSCREFGNTIVLFSRTHRRWLNSESLYEVLLGKYSGLLARFSLCRTALGDGNLCKNPVKAVLKEGLHDED